MYIHINLRDMETQMSIINQIQHSQGYKMLFKM